MKKPDKVNIHYACPIPWDELESLDERSKYCDVCALNVKNFIGEEKIDPDAHCGRFLLNQVSRIRTNLSLPAMGLYATSLFSAFNLMPGLTQSQTIGTTQSPKTEQVSHYTWVKIRGTIKDKETGDGLPFVNVVVNAGDTQLTGGSTDFDGRFFIEVDTTGASLEDLSLRIKYIGYSPIQIDGLDTTDLELEMELGMEPDTNIFIMGGYHACPDAVRPRWLNVMLWPVRVVKHQTVDRIRRGHWKRQEKKERKELGLD